MAAFAVPAAAAVRSGPAAAAMVAARITWITWITLTALNGGPAAARAAAPRTRARRRAEWAAPARMAPRDALIMTVDASLFRPWPP
ncbi:hypothetical protein E2R25_07355 [Burkholderia pseudomallei]|nr:hypothetical protein EXY28_07375 [Burkholderia pseudomallei]QBP49669.1 hypothetical protein E2R28_07330 [Burkholderia pseudomallei]QBP69588.1 hypothetical protein E2R25_07355 [Burkholderia pseudomallei]QBR23552.1 hypothetical protein E3O37_07455 [Burkholderia pseudomallei]